MRQPSETMQIRRMRQHRVVIPQICCMRQREAHKGSTTQIYHMRQCRRIDTQIRRMRQRGSDFGGVSGWVMVREEE